MKRGFIDIKNLIKVTLLILITFVLGSCVPKKEAEPELDIEEYRMEIDAWHQKRVENLKGPTGWLNLAGLFWLEEGINTMGSGPANTLVFPEGKIPDRAGFFILKQNTVVFESAPGVTIRCNGKPVQRMMIFHPDSSKAPMLEYESLRWFIVRRDTKTGVRLRDLTNPESERFSGIDRYPVNPAWRLTARFVKADSGRTINITNVLGQTTAQRSPGALVFSIAGKEYQLDALDEGGEELFVIFGDPSNAKETYGAGRYLYVMKPGADGVAIVDFNRAQNPPCAFTAFATCPLPPVQNILSIEINAGEKNYGDYVEHTIH